MNTVLAIFLGGGLGSLARYGVSRLITSDLLNGGLPWATILANLMACILLAFVMLRWHDALLSKPSALPMLAVGFCGGFSTFSTFSLENYMLLKQGAVLSASLNVLISVGACLFIFYIIAQRT